MHVQRATVGPSSKRFAWPTLCFCEKCGVNDYGQRPWVYDPQSTSPRGVRALLLRSWLSVHCGSSGAMATLPHAPPAALAAATGTHSNSPAQTRRSTSGDIWPPTGCCSLLYKHPKKERKKLFTILHCLALPVATMRPRVSRPSDGAYVDALRCSQQSRCVPLNKTLNHRRVAKV